MCGILGIISKNPISVLEALKRLKRLEYRGYDSAGFATREGFVLKRKGEIDSLIKEVKEKYSNLRSNIIILHTRWATHGKVSDINAHPHTDCTGNIFVVHNGTIDNFEEIKKELIKKGHKFMSETDTEVIAHFIEDRLKEGKDMKEIAKEIFKKFEGTYAILVLFRNKNKLYAIKNGSPLVLGMDKDTVYIASDVYAFLDKTQRIIVLDDYEFVEIEL